MEVSGLICKNSIHDVPTTVEKFIAAAQKNGLALFGQRDFAALPAFSGTRPAVLVQIGNPQVIKQLMAANGTIGVDLPMKAFIAEGADGETVICYNDPKWLMQRHGLTGPFSELANKMTAVLNTVATAAAS